MNLLFHIASFECYIFVLIAQKFLDGLCLTLIDSTCSCSAIAAYAVDVLLRYKYRLLMVIKRLHQVNFVSPLSYTCLRDQRYNYNKRDDVQEISIYPLLKLFYFGRDKYIFFPIVIYTHVYMLNNLEEDKID